MNRKGPAVASPRRLYALTVWAPWSSLIIEGWKPYEFRKWDYRLRRPDLVGQRIAIHAGARPVHNKEVLDLLERMNGKHSRVSEAARPFLVQLTLIPGLAPLAAVLGTAVLGEPIECRQLFSSGTLTYPDSDRVEHQAWAWPLRDIERFDVPVPARGAQGLWSWSNA
jgi:hypothetical protein